MHFRLLSALRLAGFAAALILFAVSGCKKPPEETPAPPPPKPAKAPQRPGAPAPPAGNAATLPVPGAPKAAPSPIPTVPVATPTPTPAPKKTGFAVTYSIDGRGYAKSITYIDTSKESVRGDGVHTITNVILPWRHAFDLMSNQPNLVVRADREPSVLWLEGSIYMNGIPVASATATQLSGNVIEVRRAVADTVRPADAPP